MSMFRRPPETDHKREGFTLLELVMVLAVLVVLASLAWPSVMRFLGEQEIAEQAHRVRMELTRTRVKAIDAGVVYQFRYEPGGRKYIVLPLERPETGNSTDGRLTTESSFEMQTVYGELSERCHFDHPRERSALTGVESPIPTERLSQQVLSLVPGGNGLSQVAFSPPIRFFPDGTADDGHLAILDDGERRVEVTVRGFTGTVRASEVHQEKRR